MVKEQTKQIISDNLTIKSVFLNRDVLIDCYYSTEYFKQSVISLLLINDGQDLRKMAFDNILNDAFLEGNIEPVFV